MSAPTQNKNQVIRHLLHIGTYLQRTGDRLTRQFGLTLQQFAVLNEVAQRGPVSHKRIVGQLLFEKSNVSKIATHLHSAGLIQITTPTDDARSRMLKVTQSGRQLRDKCIKSLITWNVTWLEPLGEDDIAAAAKILGKLSNLIGWGREKKEGSHDCRQSE